METITYQLTCRDGNGRVYITDVNQDDLARHIEAKFKHTDHEIIAIIKL